MEEHAEAKFKALQKIKNKYKVQIAIATTQKDKEKVAKLEEEQASEKKKMEDEMTEKSTAGKLAIKDRYNELAQQVTIDANEFVKALLSKKEKVPSQPITLQKAQSVQNTLAQLEEAESADSNPSAKGDEPPI